MIRLVLDGPTMRVMYFTNDFKQDLNLVDGTLLYDHYGTRPVEMELSNCWNWKLIGNKLVNTEATVPNTPVTLFEHNRKETRKLLIEKINNARKPLLPSCTGGDLIRNFKITDNDFIKQLAKSAGLTEEQYLANVQLAKQLNEEKLKNTEINREYYNKKLNDATTDEETFAIRDKFANTDLTQL